MRKVRMLCFVFLLVMLGACATTAKYEAVLDTWVGHTEQELIESWGVPVQVYQTGNKKYLVYQRGNTAFIPGTPANYRTTIYGNTAYTTSYGGSSPMIVNYHCTTTFMFEDEIIVSWRWEGNNCVSK